MAKMMGTVALLLGILVLGGCADPYGYNGYGYDGTGGYGGYGGGCAQSYGSMPLPIPVPMDAGYPEGYASAVPYYQPQAYAYPQPYYDNSAQMYPPQYQDYSNSSPYDQSQAPWQQPGMAAGPLSPQENQAWQAGGQGPNRQGRTGFNHPGAAFTASTHGPPPGSGFHPGYGNMAQPGYRPGGPAGNAPSVWGGRAPGFPPGNRALAPGQLAGGPRFQPNNRVMQGRPSVNGARFQARPMPARPQIMRPAPGPRRQPNGGAGLRRIAHPSGG